MYVDDQNVHVNAKIRGVYVSLNKISRIICEKSWLKSVYFGLNFREDPIASRKFQACISKPLS